MSNGEEKEGKEKYYKQELFERLGKLIVEDNIIVEKSRNLPETGHIRVKTGEELKLDNRAKEITNLSRETMGELIKLGMNVEDLNFLREAIDSKMTINSLGEKEITDEQKKLLEDERMNFQEKILPKLKAMGIDDNILNSLDTARKNLEEEYRVKHPTWGF